MAETNGTKSGAVESPAPGGGDIKFLIQKIYVKDLSFESPNSPKVFSGEWQPEVNMDLQTQSKSVGENLYETVLIVTVTVKNQGEVAFLIEVKQAGIFTIETDDKKALNETLGIFTPNLLFPYVRKTVSDAAGEGGFPPLYLSPINFEHIYRQHMEKSPEAAAGKGKDEGTPAEQGK